IQNNSFHPYPAGGGKLHADVQLLKKFLKKSFFFDDSFPARGGLRPPSALPHGWAYPAHTRGSFRFTTKGTKGVPGLRPWTPAGGHYHPPNSARMYALAAPPRKGLCHQPRPICHFEMGGENRSFFSLGFCEG